MNCDHLTCYIQAGRTSCPRGIVSPQAKPSSSSPHISGFMGAPPPLIMGIPSPDTDIALHKVKPLRQGRPAWGWTWMSLQILIGACFNVATIFIKAGVIIFRILGEFAEYLHFQYTLSRIRIVILCMHH